MHIIYLIKIENNYVLLVRKIFKKCLSKKCTQNYVRRHQHLTHTHEYKHTHATHITLISDLMAAHNA